MVAGASQAGYGLMASCEVLEVHARTCWRRLGLVGKPGPLGSRPWRASLVTLPAGSPRSCGGAAARSTRFRNNPFSVEDNMCICSPSTPREHMQACLPSLSPLRCPDEPRHGPRRNGGRCLPALHHWSMSGTNLSRAPTPAMLGLHHVTVSTSLPAAAAVSNKTWQVTLAWQEREQKSMCRSKRMHRADAGELALQVAPAQHSGLTYGGQVRRSRTCCQCSHQCGVQRITAQPLRLHGCNAASAGGALRSSS